MVFLIRNTQNRDSKAMQLKLDEVVRAGQGARNELVNLEELSDEDLTKLEGQFKRVRERPKARLEMVNARLRLSRIEAQPSARFQSIIRSFIKNKRGLAPRNVCLVWMALESCSQGNSQGIRTTQRQTERI